MAYNGHTIRAANRVGKPVVEPFKEMHVQDGEPGFIRSHSSVTCRVCGESYKIEHTISVKDCGWVCFNCLHDIARQHLNE